MSESLRCDRNRIGSFLRQELSDVEQRQLEQHLDSCEVCQVELDRSTAASQDWSDASDFLRDEPFDLERLGDLCDDDLTQDALADRSFHLQQIIGLLGPTDDPDKLGRIGRYEIAAVIGSGGMGIVLKGFDPALNRFVAIKVLAPHMASTAAARKRFQREAQAAAAVVHENVLAIHGVDTANGLPYLVMPYIRGISLEARIHADGALPLIDVLRIGKQTAAGLAAAHAQGLVHRDIKPSNILLTDGAGRVAITDFGLARTVDDASLTRTGMIAGTPQYMSPEQARGETVSHRSDLFSLGSVLYAMCTGRSPFRGETSYAVLRRITDNDPRSIRELNPEIPEWLEVFIGWLHQKEPARRPQSAAEVATLLERCLAHVQQPASIELPRGVLEMTQQSKQLTRPPNLRRRWIPVIASVLLLFVAITVAAIDLVGNKNRHASPSPQQQRTSGSPATVDGRPEMSMFLWSDQLSHDLDELTIEIDQLEFDLNSAEPSRVDSSLQSNGTTDRKRTEED